MKQVDSKNDIVILGATFHGVDEIIMCAKNNEPKDGVWVGEDSHLYPCFDSSDSLYEKRRYWNFIFDRSEEGLKQKIEQLQKSSASDQQYKKLSPEFHPMVYWEGEYRYPLEVTEDDDMQDLAEPTDDVDTPPFDILCPDISQIDIPEDIFLETPLNPSEETDFVIDESKDYYPQVAAELIRRIRIEIKKSYMPDEEDFDYKDSKSMDKAMEDRHIMAKLELKRFSYLISIRGVKNYSSDDYGDYAYYELSFAELDMHDYSSKMTSTSTFYVARHPSDVMSYLNTDDSISLLSDVLQRNFNCIDL